MPVNHDVKHCHHPATFPRFSDGPFRLCQCHQRLLVPLKLAFFLALPNIASVASPKAPVPPPTQGPDLSQEEQDALKASVFQRLHPRVYLERFIAEDVRPDGRTFDTFRDISVNVGEYSFA